MPSLKNLRLDGNPVFYYPVYREFTIAALPQLTNLDGLQVTSYERESASDVIKGERQRFSFLVELEQRLRKYELLNGLSKPD